MARPEIRLGAGLYPRAGPARRRMIAKDLLLILCLVLFAWIALKVHDQIARLEGLGNGVVQAGGSVEHGFRSMASSVSGLPVVGDQLSQGLRGAGADTGGAAVAAGQQGETDVARLANLVGWLIFLAPSALLMQRFLPGRVRQLRAARAAARVLDPSIDEAHRSLIAQRAAFSLPFEQLLRYTDDPLGDLGAGRYEPLVRAVLDDAGLSHASG